MRGLLAILVLVLVGCSDDPPPPSPHPTPPAFRALDIIASEIRMVDPAEETVLEVGGARLEIPPGTLANPVEVILVQTVNPAETLRLDDGALDGQSFLADGAYAFFTDRRVDLLGPIFLELPLSPERLGSANPGEARVSVVTGGFVSVQGPPERVVDGRMRVRIDGDFLPAGPPFSGALRTFGSVPFVSTVAGLSVLGTNVQAFVPTIDDPRAIFRFETIATEHFRVRYRSTGMAEAQAVADALEEAYVLFVDELGFTLPNVVNFDEKYTVVVDDFDNFAWSTASAPDGMNLPGSLFMEGASYVNADESRPSEGFPSVAVHEYFHALQYGALTRTLPNAWTAASDPQGNWLFEGTATVMAGRIRAGNVGPRIDPAFSEHHPARWPIYGVPRGVDPPADVAQELFYFIERLLGGTDHYRDIFEGLGTDLPFIGDREPSVAAVEEALRARGSSLGEAYGGWVRDYLFDHPDDYGSDAPPNVMQRLDATGMRSADARLVMPPLSYEHRLYPVPPLDPDVLPSEQVGDVEIVVRVREGDPFDVIVFAEHGGFVEELQPLEADTDQVVAVLDVRTEFDEEVRVGIASRGIDLDASVTLDVSVRLTGDADVPPEGIPDATEGIVLYDAGNEIRGRDIGMDADWTVPASAAVPELVSATDDGALLVVGRSAPGAAVDTVSLVSDFGRGTPRDVLADCDALTGGVAWPRMIGDGTIHFIGETDVEGMPREAVFRATSTVCAPIPIDFDGDGMDDTGEVDVSFGGLVPSSDGTRIGLIGPSLEVFTAPAAGGRTEATAYVATEEASDVAANATFAIAPDGSALAAGPAGGALFHVPGGGGDPNELEMSARRLGGVSFVGDRTLFAAPDALIFQLRGRASDPVTIDPEATPRGLPVESHGGRLLCFPGGADGLYCAREDGRGLVRLLVGATGAATVHYWPDR